MRSSSKRLKWIFSMLASGNIVVRRKMVLSNWVMLTRHLTARCWRVEAKVPSQANQDNHERENSQTMGDRRKRMAQR